MSLTREQGQKVARVNPRQRLCPSEESAIRISSDVRIHARSNLRGFKSYTRPVTRVYALETMRCKETAVPGGGATVMKGYYRGRPISDIVFEWRRLTTADTDDLSNDLPNSPFDRAQLEHSALDQVCSTRRGSSDFWVPSPRPTSPAERWKR
ncbi:hypothetical protein KM043_013477 [Ampulex compressa]|nr:hypothetical protein KM043_013477 [Ampulex compressa]